MRSLARRTSTPRPRAAGLRRGAQRVVLGLALLAAAGPAGAGPSGVVPRRQLSTPETPLRQIPEPTELETVARFLDEMGYTHRRVDEAQRHVLVRVRGQHGVYDLYVIPRGRLVHFQIPRLGTFSEAAAGVGKLLGLLHELNWLNVLGKYSWDSQDGELRYGYAHVAPGGLSFGAFALAVAQCLSTVDEDMPRIRRTFEAAMQAREGAPEVGVIRPPSRPAGRPPGGGS